MTDCYDVVVLGGGPIGLAAAIAIAQRGGAVAVLERRALGQHRVGETLGPEARPLLTSLGVWGDFLALGPVPFRGVRSAWGSANLGESSSITRPLGEGWHIDRARFDACLAARAAAVGVVIRERVGLPAVERSEAGVRAKARGGPALLAGLVIDASGRGAPGTAALPGRRFVSCDRQIALCARLPLPAGRELAPELLIESAEVGWWYVAPQPDRSLLFCLITDPDLLPEAASQRGAFFLAELSRTAHARRCSEGAAFAGPPRVVRADVGALVPGGGAGFVAVGDAAFAGDPLSGDGLVRGLGSAIAAAEDAARGAWSGAAHPRDVSAAFLQYLHARSRYYGMEARWPASRFWRRRQPVAYGTPITLDPQARLTYDGRPPPPDLLAGIESLAPARALLAALQRMRPSCRSHEALSALREVAPLGDLRLLIALQRLVSERIAQTL